MVVGDSRWCLGVDINRAQMLECSRKTKMRAWLRAEIGAGLQLRVDNEAGVDS